MNIKYRILLQIQVVQYGRVAVFDLTSLLLLIILDTQDSYNGEVGSFQL